MPPQLKKALEKGDEDKEEDEEEEDEIEEGILREYHLDRTLSPSGKALCQNPECAKEMEENEAAIYGDYCEDCTMMSQLGSGGPHTPHPPIAASGTRPPATREKMRGEMMADEEGLDSSMELPLETDI